MSPTIRQYSFFNRWFIFKRRRGGSLPQGEESILELPKTMPSVTPSIVTKVAPEVSEANIAAQKSKLAGAEGLATVPAAAAPAAVKTPAAAPLGAEENAENSSVKQVTIKLPEGGGGGPGGAKEGLRTMPVQQEAQTRQKYSLKEIFQFYNDASLSDKLGLGEADAARWLSPSAPFPITDLEDDTIYPTVEHYIAAMKYKKGTTNPQEGAKIAKVFSREGEIHQSFLRTRAIESAQGARTLSAQRDHDLLKAERMKVLEESNPTGMSGMKKYRLIKFDEGKWNSVKDKVLRDALTQRWEKDEKLRRILTGVKAKGLILLYYTGPGSGSELGAKRTSEGYIDGDNKVGKILMELGGWK
jgi:predicted NAD-dependent protein-ADP-ribosyltransferase YbiA (DUF1768 family)